MWDMRRTRRILNRANQMIDNFKALLREEYGFVADPSKPLWHNVNKQCAELAYNQVNTRPTNLACHNHLENNKTPCGIKGLLGLGLNYCITSKHTKTVDNTFRRLREDVRRQYAFTQEPPEDNEDNSYIPQLYIKSDYEFP